MVPHPPGILLPVNALAADRTRRPVGAPWPAGKGLRREYPAGELLTRQGRAGNSRQRGLALLALSALAHLRACARACPMRQGPPPATAHGAPPANGPQACEATSLPIDASACQGAASATHAAPIPRGRHFPAALSHGIQMTHRTGPPPATAHGAPPANGPQACEATSLPIDASLGVGPKLMNIDAI
eukprot:CAMPEP_0206030770 /NCGR_PEP_ID=MMETSP1464-20131121/47683_1 /ASSEMBLY_ACC=CAM_ASM_001124 /TAXON_ID=119497 /ORGANISM="Exanthemachrysis gayraliae, Strain RCC1523" /LENGTH=185 /DNA_ID=CAMNT_0053404877 /DNA_START=44 /DNA_END=601 /DNA_ORIENTATION=+